MTGWTPIFEEIIASSIWDEAMHVRVVWITILAVTRKDGIAPLKTVPSVARAANLSQEQAQEAIDILLSPDKRRLGQEHEGRRIEQVEGGYKVLNWEKFRARARAQLVKESNREAQARYRKKNVTEALSCEAWQGENASVSKGGDVGEQTKNIAATRKPGSIDECIPVAQRIGLSEADARAWFVDCEACNWTRGDGTPFNNWRRQMVIHRDKLREARARNPAGEQASMSLLEKSIRAI